MTRMVEALVKLFQAQEDKEKMPHIYSGLVSHCPIFTLTTPAHMLLRSMVEEHPFMKGAFFPAGAFWLEFDSEAGRTAGLWMGDGLRKERLSSCGEDGSPKRGMLTLFTMDHLYLGLRGTMHLDLDTGECRDAQQPPHVGFTTLEEDARRFFSSWARLMASPKTHTTVVHDLAKLNKRRAAAGKPPKYSYREIRVQLGPPQERTRGPREEPVARRCLHFVRCHTRIKQGHMELVRAHWRGDASLGTHFPRYRVGART